MGGHLSERFCAAVFLLISIVALAGSCSHPSLTQQGPTADSKDATQASNEVSQKLIGKQIRVRGKLLWGKPGAYVLLDSQQEVILIPDLSNGPFTWGPPYSAMEGKLVTATGILRFVYVPEDAPRTNKEGRLIDRGSSYFYFDLKTTQLRPIDH